MKAALVGHDLYPQARSNSFAWDDAQSFGRRPRQDTPNAAMQSAWFYADVNAIASESSSLQLIVEERAEGGWQEVPDHEFARLWAAPNSNMGRGFVTQFWTWQLYLFGKAFLYFAPDASGTSREIWPLPTASVKAVGSDERFIDHYTYSVNKDGRRVTYELPPELICYSRFVNPFDPRDGMAPLVAAGRAIATDSEMSNSNLSFFSDGNAQPTGICRISGTTGDADFLRLRDDIQSNFGHGKHKTLFVRGDDIDYKILQWSPSELMFTELRDVSEREIHRACGVPDGYWSEKANRANAEHADQVLINSVIWPIASNFSEDVQAQVIAPRYGENTRCRFRDIRRRNVDLEIRELDAKKDFYTVEELRTQYPPPKVSEAAWLGGDAADPRNGMLLVELAKLQPLPTEPDALAKSEEPRPEAAPGGAKALWMRKAIKRLKAKGSASCPFESDEIDDGERARIVGALAACKTADEVRAVFDPATLDTLVAEVRSARLALEAV